MLATMSLNKSTYHPLLAVPKVNVVVPNLSAERVIT